jgi:hypothetical protein
METPFRYSNARLRSADIGGSRYGVSVQKVVVFSDTATDPFYLESGTWAAKPLLERMSDKSAVSGISHDEHCLVHLFTAHDIPGSVQVNADKTARVIHAHEYTETLSSYAPSPLNLFSWYCVNASLPKTKLKKHTC